MVKKKLDIIEGIELGLNLLAQDLIFKSHTEKDLQDFLDKFKIYQKDNRKPPKRWRI